MKTQQEQDEYDIEIDKFFPNVKHSEIAEKAGTISMEALIDAVTNRNGEIDREAFVRTIRETFSFEEYVYMASCWVADKTAQAANKPDIQRKLMMLKMCKDNDKK